MVFWYRDMCVGWWMYLGFNYLGDVGPVRLAREVFDCGYSTSVIEESVNAVVKIR